VPPEEKKTGVSYSQTEGSDERQVGATAKNTKGRSSMGGGPKGVDKGGNGEKPTSRQSGSGKNTAERPDGPKGARKIEYLRPMHCAWGGKTITERKRQTRNGKKGSCAEPGKDVKP